MPNDYELKDNIPSKMIAIISMCIVLTIQIAFFITIIKDKIRSAFLYRLFRFNFMDLIEAMQIVMGITLVVLWYYLFLIEKHHQKFVVPIQEEVEFELWISWSRLFRLYKILLAYFAKVVLLDCVLKISLRYPSFAIMFETIESAKKDLFYFSACVLLYILTAVFIFYILFGQNLSDFANTFDSFQTVCLMVMGKFDYKEMYRSHP